MMIRPSTVDVLIDRPGHERLAGFVTVPAEPADGMWPDCRVIRGLPASELDDACKLLRSTNARSEWSTYDSILAAELEHEHQGAAR